MNSSAGSKKVMDSSDSLSSDWDVISSTNGITGEVSLPAQDATDKNFSSEMHGQKGSAVQEIASEALTQDEFHNESNTSSDIDIIDDIDYNRSTSDLEDLEKTLSLSDDGCSLMADSSILSESAIKDEVKEYVSEFSGDAESVDSSSPSVEILSSTPENSSRPMPEECRGPQTGGRILGEHVDRRGSWFSAYFLPLFDSMMNNVHLVKLAASLLIGLSVVIIVHQTDFSQETLFNLQKNIDTLQAENAKLRNQILSKMENDKLLHGLEEQITALKHENYKLSKSMHSLLHQMEEQNSAMRKDRKGKGPYKEEFEKLNEQINILRIDNEDLQKQLVRMRYGIFSQHNQKKEVGKDKKGEIKDPDNSTELLSEEVKELKRQLYLEVEKLKDWKETVLTLVSKFGEKQKENEKHSFKKSESFDHEKSSPDDGKSKYWSMKDLKSQFDQSLDTLSKIDFQDMWKKKVEGAFGSVSHYFKKAQEKTKKVFDSYNDGENEVWNFMEKMKKDWNDIKNDFFERHYGRKAAFVPEDEKSDESHGSTKSKEARKPFDPLAEDSSHVALDYGSGEESAAKSPDFGKSDFEQSEAGTETETTDDQSWMFERAEHRSQLREEEPEQSATNWFLRKKRVDNPSA